MGVINSSWYSRNQSIAYPVDETATLVSDTGDTLPSDIIVDLALRWPGILGNQAFLASVTVTPGIVSVTIQAASDSGFSPLAAVSVPQPVAPYRPYALSPQVAGTGGWIVFGSGVSNEPYQGRFSTTSQSLLTARAARASARLPVTGFRALGADQPLTGIITLRALSPLAISAEEREIGGVLRDCIVIGLSENDDSGGYPVPAGLTALTGDQNQSVFDQFSGPCGARPDNRSCADPQPIEFINSIGPDCSGTITLALAGCAVPIPVAGTGSAVISCAFGLAAACPAPQLPDGDGNLPNGLPPPSFESVPGVPSVTSAAGPTGGSVCTDCFFNGSTIMVPQVGLWHVIHDSTDIWRDCAGDSGSLSDEHPAGLYVYETNSAAGRNVSLLVCAGLGLVGRQITTHIKFRHGVTGALHNAAVICGYQAVIDQPGQSAYYLGEVDYDSQLLRISFYTGAAFVTLGTLTVPGIQLEKWYELTLTAGDGEFGPYTLTATVKSLDGSINATLSAPDVSIYPPYLGQLGIATNRAISKFSIVGVV